MKVYFVGAISQKQLYGDNYERIIQALTNKGYGVQYDHIMDQTEVDIVKETDDEKVNYYKKFLKWLNKADVVVAEASFPSTVHVGHEISLALEKGKPVVVLFMKGKAPVFLQGIVSDKLFVQEYTDTDLENVVVDTVEFASQQQDTRFNFFISPRIASYLDWIAKTKKTPRAVYLRDLIQKRMETDKEYQA